MRLRMGGDGPTRLAPNGYAPQNILILSGAARQASRPVEGPREAMPRLSRLLPFSHAGRQNYGCSITIFLSGN